MEKEPMDSPLIKSRKNYIFSPAWYPKDTTSNGLVSKGPLSSEKNSPLIESRKNYVVSPSWFPKKHVGLEIRSTDQSTKKPAQEKPTKPLKTRTRHVMLNGKRIKIDFPIFPFF